ncbi:hypothetical protein [Hoyosella subflava]|nr:hypothetical protein [Hoyosella subflava]
MRLLSEHDSETADALPRARTAMGGDTRGFARAIVTAPQREAVATTVLRALKNACPSAGVGAEVSRRVEAALSRALDRKLATPSYHEIQDLVREMVKERPLLLVIDEFGKNLEAYSASGADGDMYLLQELAEWATDTQNDLPLIVVTIQHLAFESYAASASTAQRREWAKVQGRFEDIPYADSASATRNLIASALDHGSDEAFGKTRLAAAMMAADGAAEVGLPEVSSTQLLCDCWPLHPVTLLALPELCARYGQNERTLFSFLASSEPLSVTTWLRKISNPNDLGWIRLDRVYDYFVESAGNFLAISQDAGRWTEVATAIRDATGLTDAQRRVLKTVGVLNLVAAAGMLRASSDLVALAAADGRDGTEAKADVHARLDELQQMSLLTYRDYAQEFRIWRGSDFDINRALGAARRLSRTRSMADMLSEVRPMQPVVAARHSTETGTVRAFDAVYADSGRTTIATPLPASVCDGVLVYRLEGCDLTISGDETVPVVVVDPEDLTVATEAAVELGALLEVAQDPGLSRDDSAAQRELAERIAYARVQLDHSLSRAFDEGARWTWVNPPAGESQELVDGVATARLSKVLDEAYSKGPKVVAYEAINRAELTSAGARARRILLEALVDSSTHGKPQFGFKGEGPEVAMYRAVISDAGAHDHRRAKLQKPTEPGWSAPWAAVVDELKSVDDAVNAQHLFAVMMSPPYGLREGTASLLLTALLVVHAPTIAIYEHGTFVPRMNAPLIERLVRNPRNFAIKHIGTTKLGGRWQYLRALNHAFDDFDLGETQQELTLLSTVQRIAGIFRQGSSRYALKSRSFVGLDDLSETQIERTVAVRKAISEAREPDVLVFDLIPQALGLTPIKAGNSKLDPKDVATAVEQIADSLRIFKEANKRLCEAIFDKVAESAVPLRADGQRLDRRAAMRAMEGAAASVATVRTVPQNVRAFIQACLMNPSTPEELGTQIATTVIGVSPQDWDDHVAYRHLTELASTARSFRRVTDLAKARASYERGDGSFEAFAITLTGANGDTVDRTVTLDVEQRKVVSAVLHTAIDRLKEHGIAPTDALLAALAAESLAREQTDLKPQNDSRGEAHG